MIKAAYKHIYFLILLIITTTPPQIADSSENHDALFKSYYLNEDYDSAAKKLVEKIDKLDDQSTVSNRTGQREILMSRQLLAYTYAWKLDRYDNSLILYEKIMSDNLTSEKRPASILILMAGIYEQKREYRKAIAYYEEALANLGKGLENERDFEKRLGIEAIVSFVRYQIDSINIKHLSDADNNHLFPKIEIAKLSCPIYQKMLLIMIFMGPFNPTIQLEKNIFDLKGIDLAPYIKKTPATIGHSFRDFCFLLNLSELSVNISSEEAIQAYINKYPDHYFSLVLCVLAYTQHLESGQIKKAKEQLDRLEKISQLRGIKLIKNADHRFSSPNNTWEFYISALKKGDLESALKCHLPGDDHYRTSFRLLGPKRIKEWANTVVRISNPETDNMSAQGLIYLNKQGREQTRDIYFTKINGEWKIKSGPL